MPTTGADPYVPGHGDPRWSATRYVLDLDYRVATNHLSGSARVTVQPLGPVADVELDLYVLKVARVLVDGERAKVTQRGHRVRVALPATTTAPFELTLDYAGKPRPMPGPDGRAGWEELTDGVLVGSQPHGAPSWFPCNDRPDDKAPYRVTITVDGGYRVVGNGRLASSRTRSGRTTWAFDETAPMAPYLACVQIGRYTVDPRPAPVPVAVVAPGGLAVGPGSAFEHQGAMVEAMTGWFGPYPFAEYVAVVADDDFEIPLEAQGLASFGRNHAAPGWANERLVAHELAHSWFGNSVTARSWTDIWLHEGFACYSEWLWSEHRGLEPVEEHARRHWERLARLPQDLVLGAPGADRMFDDRVYKRGALTLHSVRDLLGDTAFFGLLRRWTTVHAHGTVTTGDFTDALADAAGREAARARSLVQDWVYRAELPALPSGA